MRPVTGPLQTGTYIQELVDAGPGKYTTVNSEQSIVLTNQSDAAKVRVFNGT